MPACQYGAVPNSTGQTVQWVWVGLATYAASRLPEWTRLAPWIAGAVADRLVNVQNLCSSNPDVPEPITPADILGEAISPLVGPTWSQAFIRKVSDALVYDAFRTLCVCNAAPNPCAQTIQMQLGNNLLWCSGGGGGYVFPGPPYTPNCSGSTGTYPLDISCAGPTDFILWMEPRTATQPGPFLYNMYDCNTNFSSGAIKGGQMFSGTYVGHPGCTNGPGFHLLWGINDGGARPQWSLDIMPGSGTGPQPTVPPVQPPDTTQPVPNPPAKPCDATTLCNITWGISIREQVNIAISNATSTTVTTGIQGQYQTGNTYTVSGEGKLQVASGTLGVVVQFVTVPPSLVPSGGDPPRYYGIGYLQLAAGDAQDGKRWIHSSGDRFIPVFPEMDGVFYNLTAGVVLDIIELVPVPPSA